ncbi:MAG: hypothetical protein OFPII_27020 [Osedax symbiont Rs1]|nr:MAG: hypothetical protein OFPII_27020 [Osedax symbiont Rs1]
MHITDIAILLIKEPVRFLYSRLTRLAARYEINSNRVNIVVINYDAACRFQ